MSEWMGVSEAMDKELLNRNINRGYRKLVV
jgi:hypothetical protein